MLSTLIFELLLTVDTFPDSVPVSLGDGLHCVAPGDGGGGCEGDGCDCQSPASRLPRFPLPPRPSQCCPRHLCSAPAPLSPFLNKLGASPFRFIRLLIQPLTDSASGFGAPGSADAPFPVPWPVLSFSSRLPRILKAQFCGYLYGVIFNFHRKNLNVQ